MSAKKSLKPPLTQMTLNFGQKSPLTKTVECKECGMMYNSKDKYDEQLHAKHHNEKDNCLRYTASTFKNEKIVQDYTGQNYFSESILML